MPATPLLRRSFAEPQYGYWETKGCIMSATAFVRERIDETLENDAAAGISFSPRATKKSHTCRKTWRKLPDSFSAYPLSLNGCEVTYPPIPSPMTGVP
jgi:hypothetical protein